MKRSRKNSDYFKAVCQTGGNKYEEVICFKPTVFKEFKQAEVNK